MANVIVVGNDKTNNGLLLCFLKRFAEENNLNKEKFSFRQIEDGKVFLREYDGADSVIIDLEHSGMNGMETAKILRSIDECVEIILVAQSTKYAIEGYDVRAVAYFVMPVSYEAFTEKLRHALIAGANANVLALKISDNTAVRVRVSDITYIEVIQHYLNVHTVGGLYRVRGTMNDFQERLNLSGFVRCAKSYLVNLKYVDSVKGYVVSIGENKFNISRSKKAEFMDALKKYSQSNNIRALPEWDN